MDPNYEFDAPSYLDFEDVRNGVENEDDVDHWFSRHSHLEKDNLGILSRPAAGADTQQQAFSGNFTSTVAVKQEQPDEVPPQTESEDSASASAAVSVKRDTGGGEECSAVETEPVTRLRQKRSATIASLQTPVYKQRRVQRDSSKKAVAAIKKILRPAEALAAKTPEHMRRYLAKKQGQVKRTREELEAEEIEKMQAESRKKLREHRKTFHRLADSGKKPAKAMKHSKPTTESVGFKFRTERRIRQRRSAAASSSSSRPPPPPPPQSSRSHASNFPMTLRSTSNTTLPTESEGPRKATEVKPFNFRLTSRFPKEAAAEGEEKKDGYVSTAEYIFRFQAGTPERFRSLPRKPLRGAGVSVEDVLQKSSSANSEGSRAATSSMTMPYTPKLLTKTRARPTQVKSSAELEEEEMAKIRQNPIKPRPLNPKIFTERGLMGMPKKAHHSVTQPHTPKLATRERGEARAHEASSSDESESDTRPTFKAQPPPKGLFDRVLGLPKKQEPAVTCPRSPAFSLIRKNLHPNTDEEKEEEKCQIIVARPVPDFSRKFEPQLDHKKTEPEPFTFEERYKDKPTRTTLIQQILEKEKKEPFKANPVPLFEPPSLPVVQPLTVTEPKTPNLRTRTRGQEYESKWRQTLSEMIQKEKENTEFRARDAKVLYKAPFRTKTDNRQITEVSNIILRTELRSEQRAEYDRERKSKEEEQQQENRERQEAMEAEEARRVAQLRQRMVHKAQPIRRYAQTVVHPSLKPLTAPQSPNFHLRLRGMH